MSKKYLILLLFFIILLSRPMSILARQGQVLGIHIMHTYEIEDAYSLIENYKKAHTFYLTIPFTLEDLNKKQQWQQFFNQAREKKMIPLVRLCTKVEDGVWVVPTRKNVVDMIDFLDQLSWPTERKYIIVFNEVNHAAEWGGTINPSLYADFLKFSYNWAKATDPDFFVLPAAMDLAAPNGTKTWEAFRYLQAMQQESEDIFEYVDAWNSHSYPNPGFSSSPTLKGKNSIRGFLHELEYLKRVTGKDYKVYITETGWIANGYNDRWLDDYYQYALDHVWSHDSVEAVTPFTLKGSPGPFAGFSFFDDQGKETVHYYAYQKALENFYEQ